MMFIQELFRRYIPAPKAFHWYQHAALTDLAGGTMTSKTTSVYESIKAAYVQAYQVSKEVFYTNIKTKHLGTTARQFDYKGAIIGWPSFYNTATTVDEAYHLQRSESWAARFELRMPYNSFLGSFDMIREEVRQLSEEGEWLYVIPSKPLADISRLRIRCCKEIIDLWKALPLRQRCQPERVTLALVCTYIMNLTLGSASLRSYLDDYDFERGAGNLFFIQEADWLALKVNPLGDDMIGRIIGPDLAKKLKHSRQSNYGRVGKSKAPAMELRNWEGASIEAVGSTIFLETFADIWRVFPQPRGQNCPRYLAADLSVDHLGVVTFCLWPCTEVLPSTEAVEANMRARWMAKFDIVFPTPARILEVGSNSWGQGWKKLRGREEYLRWTVGKEDAEVEELRAFLFDKFEDLRWIPNFTKGAPVWRTAGGKVQVAHRAYDPQAL
jgi:hypothetical protein